MRKKIQMKQGEIKLEKRKGPCENWLDQTKVRGCRSQKVSITISGYNLWFWNRSTTVKAVAHRERCYATHGMPRTRRYVAFNRFCVFPICAFTPVAKLCPLSWLHRAYSLISRRAGDFLKTALLTHARASTFGIPRGATPTPTPRIVHHGPWQRQVIYTPQSPWSN